MGFKLIGALEQGRAVYLSIERKCETSDTALFLTLECLIDISDISDEALKARSLEVFSELVLRALSRLRGSAKPLDEVATWLPLLQRLLEAPSGLAAMSALVRYMVSVAKLPPDELKTTVAVLGKPAEEAIMTTADQLRAEGRDKGRIEGAASTLIKLVHWRFPEVPAELDARIAQTSRKQLELWCRKYATATTLAAIFEDDD